MNIFAVHEDPVIAAEMLCDKHVVKMVVEGCQMLSTIHHMDYMDITDNNFCHRLYKPAYKNHPCTKWARENQANYFWLAEHTFALSCEYTARYGKTHKANGLSIDFMKNIPYFLRDTSIVRTPFAQAMPDKYKCEDGVTAYRNYYIGEKAKIAKWKHGNTPQWFLEGIQNQCTKQTLHLP
jgi:hypothetical protein